MQEEECPNELKPVKGIFSVTTKFILDSKDTSIFCDLEISDYANLIFTIDTGAMTSIIKSGRIRQGTKVCRDSTQFRGLVKNHHVQSIGKITTNLTIDNENIKHTFYIIKDDINLSNDGILGLDFLKTYKAKINYNKSEMKMQFPIYANIIHKKTETIKAPNTKEDENPELVLAQTHSENVETKEFEKTKNKQEGKIQFCDSNEVFSYEPVNEIRKNKNPERKKKKKQTNENFFLNLSNNYFKKQNFPKIYPQPILIESEPKENKMLNELVNMFEQNQELEMQSSILMFNSDEKEHEYGETIQTMDNFFEIPSDIIEENTNVENRMKYLKENIQLNHCTEDEKQSILETLKKYTFAFQIPGDKFRHTDLGMHKINLLPGTSPVYIRQYRIPEHNKMEIQRQINELEEKGIISKCDSPWNSPIFLVPKKENNLGEKQSRLVIDYRELNKVIEPSAYPVPLIDEIIDQMKGSKYYTVLDLYGAYHQLPLDPSSRPYTSFCTSWEKYCFNSVPFGLSSSPYAWLRAISTVLKGLIGRNVFVYMDDIIVFAPNLTKHIEILAEVFKKIALHKLKLKIDKSKFLKNKVAYLGFIISSEGLMTDSKKVECIQKFPIPKSVKETQSFLGLSNYYRRYVENYAEIARPLYDLCKKDVKYKWNEECDMAFNTLKNALSNPPVLIFPDFNEKFILHTDASNIAVGSVLTQGEIPNDRAICYFSKTLNSAQTRYSTVEKELLAIILSVENFNYYLTGREFLIVTDHRPLTYLFNSKNISARLHRWKYTLMGYQFKVVYVKGSQNVVADALSRIKIDESEIENEPEIIDNLFLNNEQTMLIQTREQRRQQMEKRQEGETTENTSKETSNEEKTKKGKRGKNVQANEEQSNEEKTRKEKRGKNVQTNGEQDNEEIGEINETIEEINESTKENEINEIHNETNKREKQRKNYIRENRNILIDSKDYDHIFYVFSKINCEMQKKLQYKLKCQIVLEGLQSRENVYSLKEGKSIVILKSILRNATELEKARQTMNQVLQICIENVHENIAINVDFNDYKSYFEFKKIVHDMFKPQNIDVTLYINKVIELTDLDEIEEILHMYHNSLLSGHTGYDRMLANIRKFYTWNGITKNVREFIKKCKTCEQAKITRHTKNPMTITDTATEPFMKLFIDIVGPVNPISIHGNVYIFTCNCSLTKFAIGVPMKDTTALSTAKALVHHVILKYGISEEIVSDNGTNFISETLKEVNKLLKIRRTFATPYRAQVNQVERFHKSLGNYLKSFIQKEQDRWCEYLDFALFAYNNSYNISTGFAPFELLYGRTSKLPTEITKREVPIYNYENYAKELRYRLKTCYDLAKENIIKSKENNKKYYDRGRSAEFLKLQINDLVLLLKPKKKYKFENPYEGPYRIEKIIGPGVVIIKKGKKSVKINTERLKLAKANYGKNIPPSIQEN